MISVEYLKAVRAITEHLQKTQLPAIEQAARTIADSLANGGAVFCSEIGHGNQQDFLNRAGGLAAVRAFSFKLEVESVVSEALTDRPRKDAVDTELESVRYALRNSNVRAGDVMVLSSVSGRGRGPVELALACREMGVRTIGLTSMDYTAHVEAAHPSGKKLFEAVNIFIDNGAPYGDAAVDIPGFDSKLLPVSGVSMVCIGWMIWGEVMDMMAKSGNPPTVFTSVNRPGGPEAYQEKVKQFNERGY